MAIESEEFIPIVALRAIEMLIEDRYKRTVLSEDELDAHVNFALMEARQDLGL